MQGVRHALDVLESPPAGKAPPVCVLFGGERFLQSLVRKQLIGTWTRGNEDAEASVAVVNGETVGDRGWAAGMTEGGVVGGGCTGRGVDTPPTAGGSGTRHGGWCGPRSGWLRTSGSVRKAQRRSMSLPTDCYGVTTTGRRITPNASRCA